MEYYEGWMPNLRKYDLPKTPYHRLIDSKTLSLKQKLDLEKEYLKFNPIEIKKALSRKVSEFNKLLKRFNQDQEQDKYLEGYGDVNSYSNKAKPS
jgi:hypothetical protein